MGMLLGLHGHPLLKFIVEHLVKARHILCEKQGKINEAFKKLQDGWLSNGDKVPPAEFAKIAAEFSNVHLGRKVEILDGFLEAKWPGLSGSCFQHTSWCYYCSFQINAWISYYTLRGKEELSIDYFQWTLKLLWSFGGSSVV
ncbi:hypothetical protein HPP92_010748 [Vanilla planifolia]|uniref:peptidylprolyl isomerase n=1 Tax=Vanilla planifolia TaxID=51239 RepID=A0A835V0D9_VANPL|nr:hypothetical protein HPP92_010748 [Vanilla planifolia]